MKNFIYFVIFTMCAVLLESCVNKRPPITDAVVETDTVEQTEYNYVPTVYEILEERQEMKYALWVDSVYLTIPEQILTHMLVTKGTTLSITEIVEDYWQNRKFYHDTILKTMNIQRKYLPDSLPKQSIPDDKIKNKDTIPIAEK